MVLGKFADMINELKPLWAAIMAKMAYQRRGEKKFVKGIHVLANPDMFLDLAAGRFVPL